MERLSHWIGGKLVPGESGRTGPVFNPATGDQTHEVDFASIDEVDQAVDTAREAFASWRRTSLSKRADLMFRIREAIHEHRADIARLITEQHGKVLSDAMGEVARGLENIEFACRCAAPAEGWVHRASLDRRRRVLDPAAAGRRRRHHAVQLPGDGAHVDVRERDRLREHVHPQAVREGPGRLALLAELLKEAGLPDGVFNVVQGDKVAVDRLLEHPDIKAVALSAPPPWPSTSTRPAPRTGSACRRWAGRRTTCSCSPMPTSAWRRMRRSPRPTARPVTLHGDLRGVAVGDAGDRLVEAIKRATAAREDRHGLEPESTWDRWSRVTTATRSPLPRLAREQGATIVEDGREHGLYRESDGFFLGVSLIDHVTTAMDAYQDEIFGPVLRSCGSTTYDEALGS